MTFKWTYLVVAAVLLAAFAALALAGGGWGAYSLVQGVGLILVGGLVVFLAQRSSKRRLYRSEVRATPEATAAPFVGYPKDQALAIFDSEQDALGATRDLQAEGYQRVDRFAGMRGATQIDSQGGAHGGVAKAERTIEHLASDVSDLEGLRRGGAPRPDRPRRARPGRGAASPRRGHHAAPSRP